MITLTIHCELLTKEEDLMNYQTLVFKNLDNAPFGNKYCMVTVWPNWQSYIPEIGDKGFLTYNSVIAGEDVYYDRNLDTIIKYKFSNLIFERFVKEKIDNFKKILL